MSASGTDGTGGSLVPAGDGTSPRRLSFQPGLGFCQFAKRAREPPRGAAFQTRRHHARLADGLDRGVTVGKGTAEEQEIAHGSAPIKHAVIMAGWT